MWSLWKRLFKKIMHVVVAFFWTQKCILNAKDKKVSSTSCPLTRATEKIPNLTDGKHKSLSRVAKKGSKRFHCQVLTATQDKWEDGSRICNANRTIWVQCSTVSSFVISYVKYWTSRNSANSFYKHMCDIFRQQNNGKIVGTFLMISLLPLLAHWILYGLLNLVWGNRQNYVDNIWSVLKP